MGGLVPAIHASVRRQLFRSMYRSRYSGFVARIKRIFYVRDPCFVLRSR